MADISRLRELMRTLRDRDKGCPWDLEQSYRTIVPHTLEEAYEVADAIETDNLAALPGELGDLLFQVIFYCQLGEEDGRFSFDEVVRALEHKLTDRHPHVFAGAAFASRKAIGEAWEAAKARERAAAAATSELDDLPLALPALSRAQKMQKRAARVGFDWPDAEGAWRKISEELAELRRAASEEPGTDAIDDELGDVLFAVVNLARHLGLESERSLRQATRKFERRFRAIELALAERALSVATATPELLDELWEAVKTQEKSTGA